MSAMTISSLIDRTFGDDFAARRRDETLPPEFDPVAAGGRFMADAIRHRDITTVRDRVTALNRFPGRMLRLAEFFFLARMPADRRRIKKNFRAAQRGQARRFRIPLVPANADADFPVRGCPRLEIRDRPA